jgi:hypothetical protein
MNNRLALYVDKDFMLAGVKPFDTFTPIAVKGYARIPLYFFVDTSANRISYGDKYRADYEDHLPNTYGDFLSSILDEKAQYRVFHYTVPVIELLKVVMDDLRREYLTILGELTSSLDPAAPIPVSISWADGVAEASRSAFAAYLRRIGYNVEEGTLVPVEMLVLSLFAAGSLLPALHKKVVVMEAFGEDLNYSMIACYNAASVERTGRHTYLLLGVDSRVNVIATYTVNYVNTRRRLLSSKEEQEKEYRRHFRFAREWTRLLDADQRPFMEVKTDFAVERGVDNKVVLKKDEIEQLVTFQVRHVSQSFELFLERENQRPEDVDKIVLLGESLRNSDELRREMARFGADKLHVSDARAEYGILDGIFLRKQYQEKPDTAPRSAVTPNLGSTLPPPATAPAGFEQVVISSQLGVGTQLELGWNDRLIRAVFIGNNRFLVVQHYKSQIITGDQFSIDTFLLGQRPVFRNITRNNQPLGDYTPSGVLNVLKKV